MPDIDGRFVRDRASEAAFRLTRWFVVFTVERMFNDRMSGLALIVGSGGMIITMVLHPTGHVAAAQAEQMIRMLIGVHGLALACLPLMFLGTWGLSRAVLERSSLAITALAVYTFALIAVMNAAVFDGLVTPGVLRQMMAGGAPADAWRALAHYNFFVNQAYAQVFVAASAVAIALWSVSTWKNRELARGLSIYGCVLAIVTIVALFSGHLDLDKHGAGLVIFADAAWFIVAGGQLMAREKRLPAMA